MTNFSPDPDFRAWHTLTVEDTLSRLATSRQGLSASEARRRLEQCGPNELQAAKEISPWKILLQQFKNVLIIILLIGTVLSAFLGHGVEAIAIAVIVLFAVLLGFFQEYRAERAMEALRQMAAPTANAIRDGREVEVPARDLVPGDIVVIHAGDKIPADARLVEAVNLQLEESALTGESVPVEKHDGPLEEVELSPGDRINMVFAGTAATYGRGRAVLAATGMQTEFGQIAEMLQSVEAGRTPLQENLDKVGRILAWAALVIVTGIVILGVIRDEPLLEMLIFGIALAVAVVPEALPAVVTISLAIGVQRLVKRNALIRRLPAVETLGSTSVICSDKTGTLTRDEMTVRRIVTVDTTIEVSGAGYEPEGEFSQDGTTVDPPSEVTELLRAAVLVSDAHLERDPERGGWVLAGDPTEGALVVAAAKAGLNKDELDGRYPRVGEIPFTSESRRMTTLHKTPDGTRAYAKGAPEVILDACSNVHTSAGDVPLDEERRGRLEESARQMAEEALRVLGVARKAAQAREEAETEMTFLGFAGMIDPPRTEAKPAIEKCGTAGIRVLMITGDHPLTAKAVAQELDLLRDGRVLTGAELDTWDDDELDAKIGEIKVFSRVSPAHKLRVVEALQRGGHVAAMTGDGVNDAPALKKADIGIAMGITGTDVSKEAAAMMLTDDNFASIVAAVEEGRGIFENIKKYLMYLLSSNIGEIGLMTGATVAGLPLPLTAVQILYVNLATDGLPALALSVDPPEDDLMDRPPRSKEVGIFTRPVVALMSIGGIWSAVINLGLFVWALRSDRGLTEAMTMTFVSLVLIQFLKAYNFRSDHRSILHRPFINKWLNIAILWEIVLLFLIVYVPILQEPLGTFSLTWVDWVIVLVVSSTIVPVLELAKWGSRHGWLGKTA